MAFVEVTGTPPVKQSKKKVRINPVPTVFNVEKLSQEWYKAPVLTDEQRTEIHDELNHHKIDMEVHPESADNTQ